MYDIASVTVLTATYHITSYSFQEKTTTSVKKKVVEAIKMHQAPTCQELGTVSVSISELLNSCISGLSFLGEAPVATLPSVPNPVRYTRIRFSVLIHSML